MHRDTISEKVFLQIGFRAPEREGSLRTIELFGIPGKRSSSQSYTPDQETQKFVDRLIVRQLFRDSRLLSSCNFEHLKIWLYKISSNNETRGYDIPRLDKNDLVIHSNLAHSKLRRIYVLDNELSGLEYEEWKKTAEYLFIPLFRNFLLPPAPPSFLQNNPLVKFADEMAGKLDPGLKMKQSIFFDSVIIQIN